MKIKEIAGSIISLGALVLYLVTMLDIVRLVKAWVPGELPVQINDGKILIATGIGGLISAVVVATLGLSEPGGAPVGTVKALSRDHGRVLLSVITIVYMGVWLILGGYVAYHGVISSPGASSTLHDIGISWFGILMGALYAYFGLNPPKNEPGGSS